VQFCSFKIGNTIGDFTFVFALRFKFAFVGILTMFERLYS
jgi:hypothetical protein